MATLIHIPLMHDIFREMPKGYVERYFGKISAAEREELMGVYEKCWDSIDAYLAERDVRKIYQDGFPRTPYPLSLFLSLDCKMQDLAKEGSRNAQTVSRLMARGGKLVPVERLIDIVAANLLMQFDAYTEGSARARDAHIVEGIVETLDKTETGVLFLGGGHAPRKYLAQPPEIQVEEFDAGFDKPMTMLATIVKRNRRK